MITAFCVVLFLLLALQYLLVYLLVFLEIDEVSRWYSKSELLFLLFPIVPVIVIVAISFFSLLFDKEIRKEFVSCIKYIKNLK